MEGRPAGRGFRADIEGLRAVAVLAVVLFHAGVPRLAGGFVGVDVFFVISGFLITGLLRRDVQETGTVRFARFYGARARRLLPAAILVLVATVLASAWLLPRLTARSVLGDAVASALYVGNYRLALRGTDYLAANSLPSPFQHYWSLGVEEQFYLVWPALILLVAIVARRFSRRETTATPLLVVLFLVAAGSFAASLLMTSSSPPWAFFSLPTRAWELAAGGLVALTVRWWRRLPGAVAATAGWLGLALIGVSCVAFGATTPFPGTAALAPVLGAALVVGAGEVPARGGAGALLSLPPARWIGRYSYSWYLWHWPVLLLAPAVVGSSLGLAARLAAMAGSAVLAVLTTELLENPIRFAAPLRRSPGRSLLLGAGVSALGVAAALIALVVVPVPVGTGVAAAAPSLRPAAPPSAARVDPQTAEIQALTAQVQAAVAASTDVQAVPANLSPALADVADDVQAPFADHCVLTWTATRQGPCVYGDPSGTTTIALVGDSHAAQWEPALDVIAKQRSEKLDVLAKVTCPLMDLPIRSPYLGREYTECEQWRGTVLDRLRAEHPALVVVGASRRYGADFGFVSYDSRWVAALGRLVSQLHSATGAAVLVLGPVPDPHTWVPRCLSEHLGSAAACEPARSVAVNQAGIRAEQQATVAAGGQYADLTDLFCTQSQCPLIVGDTMVFRDDNHVTVEYASWLSPVLSAIVNGAFVHH